MKPNHGYLFSDVRVCAVALAVFLAALGLSPAPAAAQSTRICGVTGVTADSMCGGSGPNNNAGACSASQFCCNENGALPKCSNTLGGLTCKSSADVCQMPVIDACISSSPSQSACFNSCEEGTYCCFDSHPTTPGCSLNVVNLTLYTNCKNPMAQTCLVGGGPSPTSTPKRSTPTPTRKGPTPTPTRKGPTPTPTSKRPTPTPTRKPACPAGYRALTFTNNCGYDVYLGENPTAPQLQSTSKCTLDSDCNPAANLECVTPPGMCTETCSKDSDCGANQACYSGPWKNASGKSVKQCFFKNFEPTRVSSPPGPSNWELPANGGQSIICIPEGPTKPPGPTGGTTVSGGACTKNSDCISNTCAAGTALDRLCTSHDVNCKCKPVFTWGGAFWGRTGCTGADPMDNTLTCQTGSCGATNGSSTARLDCNSNTSLPPTSPEPPVFLVEPTLEVPPRTSYNSGAQDFYDTSIVSGFNAGLSMVPVPGTYAPPFSPSNPKQCGPDGYTVALDGKVKACPFDLLNTCPSDLQYKDGSSHVAGCWAPTQACTAASSTQKAALGCTKQVPFLCKTNSDCPYGQTSKQTMTCSISGGQAFGQCECKLDTDCPKGFTCSGSPGTCTQKSGTNATWANLYGCSGFYGLTPYGANKNETGIVCGCPSWTPGQCGADNINWEKVPVGRTGPVPAPAPTPSAGDLYLVFHQSCPVTYAYPYDDSAGTFGCTKKEALTGPSYDLAFCPGPKVSPTATPPK